MDVVSVFALILTRLYGALSCLLRLSSNLRIYQTMLSLEASFMDNSVNVFDSTVEVIKMPCCMDRLPHIMNSYE